MVHAIAPAIFFLTVGLSLTRPRISSVRIEPWVAALFGASATVAFGLVSLPQLEDIAAFLAKPVVTLLSLMVMTIVADRSGLFRLLAWRLATLAEGDAKKLFALLFAGGAAMGWVFGNDATVLILTPLVFRLVEDIQGDERWSLAQKLPFYFAVLYVANLVGPMLVSNPIHLVATRWFDLGFAEHAAWMIGPALASMAVTFLGLWLFFRRSLPARYRVPPRPEVDRRYARASALVLMLTLCAFFGESLTGLPVSLIAACGALLMLVLQAIMSRRGPVSLLPDLSWDAIVFLCGIFVVINGMRAVGATDGVEDVVAGALAHGEPAGVAASGFMTAGASALMNNHPAADTMGVAIYDLGLDRGTSHLLAYATLIGGDLGPKMLPIGSLAALIWFRLLRRRGVEVSYRTYIKVGVPVTLMAVVASLAVLLTQFALFGLP